MVLDIPVTKNEEYEIKIDDLGVNGEGIGRIDGYTLFVQGALPGEKIKVKVIKVNKKYGYGKLLEVIEPSPDRVQPVCKHARRCGGCQLQHLSYSAQLDFKTKLVQDAFERIGRIKDKEVKPTIGMEKPWRYRNKAQFPVGIMKDRLAIGFYAPRSHEIIDMDSCHIQHGVNDMLVNIIRDFIDKYSISTYDESSRKGIIRHIVIKTGFTSNEIMVIVVTATKELPHKDELINMIREAVPNVSSIVQNVNSKDTNVILGYKNTTIWGKDYIIDSIDDLKFKISPLSFFQVNPVQTSVLYRKALEYARLTGNETVIDAYCGIGTISLFMAKKAKKVYGIEVVDQAVRDARENAKLNGINNVEFMTGKSEDIIHDLIRSGIKADVVVVDPPRKGCESIFLDTIAEMSPDRIVYVSCNPATLARDAGYLSERGYHPVEVQPVDMFPHTAHVETVVLMSRL